MPLMKTLKTKSAIGIRPKPEFRKTLEQIAKTHRRSVASVVVYIVEEYLSSTNGQLLRPLSTIDAKLIDQTSTHVA